MGWHTYDMTMVVVYDGYMERVRGPFAGLCLRTPGGGGVQPGWKILSWMGNGLAGPPPPGGVGN